MVLTPKGPRRSREDSFPQLNVRLFFMQNLITRWLFLAALLLPLTSLQARPLAKEVNGASQIEELRQLASKIDRKGDRKRTTKRITRADKRWAKRASFDLQRAQLIIAAIEDPKLRRQMFTTTSARDQEGDAGGHSNKRNRWPYLEENQL